MIGACRDAQGSATVPLMGRTEAMEDLRAAVVPRSVARLIVLHGPMGVGKSHLLQAFAAACAAEGVPCEWWDGGFPPGDGTEAPLAEPTENQATTKTKRIRVCDANLSPASLEALIVGGFLDGIAPGTVWIVSARRPPSRRCLLLPSWGQTVRGIQLDTLDPEASRELVDALGVPTDEREAVVAFGRGSPLLLKLASQHARDNKHGLCDPQHLEDALRGLLPLPEARGASDVQQVALRACAMARRTTPEMLQALLGSAEASREAFDWLGSLSFVDDTTEGLRMQQVARRALMQEMWAHYPSEYLRLHRRLKEYAAGQVHRAVDGPRWIACAFYLDHQVSELRHYVVWEDAPACRRVDVARSADWPTLYHAVLEHEGEDAARILKHWADAIPEAVEVVRGSHRAPEGLMVTLPLDRRLVHDHLAEDPALEAIRSYMESKAVPDQEPWGIVHRFWMDRRTYQEPSPTLTELLIRMIARGLGVRELPFSLWVTRDAHAWLRLARVLDVPAELGSDFHLGGVTYSLLALDWRQTDRADWMFRFVQRPIDEIGELWWKRVAGSARVACGGSALRKTLRPGAGQDAPEHPSTSGGLGDLIMDRMRRLAREAQLTKREIEVLDLLLLGRNTDEIALVLDIAPRTAKFHQGNVLRKLGADSRADLVRLLL